MTATLPLSLCVKCARTHYGPEWRSLTRKLGTRAASRLAQS